MRITTPASRLRRSDPNPRRLRAWAQRNAGGELRLGLGFCRVVSPALALTSPHEVPSVDELRLVQVVDPASDPEIVRRRRAAPLVRNDVMELDLVCGATGLACRAYERAGSSVALPHEAAHFRRDRAPLRLLLHAPRSR